MAAGTFALYNKAVKNIGNATINLGSGNFRWTLHTSASNANTATLSTYGSVTGELTEANGYSSSGKAVTTRAWTQGTSAHQYKFDGDDPFWSANGGTISNIKWLVLWQSGGKLVARVNLSSAQFNLSAGNRLTITIPSTGIFTAA